MNNIHTFVSLKTQNKASQFYWNTMDTDRFLKYFTLLLLLVTQNVLLAQSDNVIVVSLQPEWEGSNLVLDSFYQMDGGDSISIEKFKCYFSKPKFYKNDTLVHQTQERFFLVDYSDSKSMNLELTIPEDLDFDAFEIQLGIDSLTHELALFSGALDPIHGMYWTWQSGYINLKIEGVSNQSSARKNKFQFHLGGYMEPYNPLQVIRRKAKNTSRIDLEIAVDKFLKPIDLEVMNHIMSPGEASVKLSKVFADHLKLKDE